MFTNRDVLFHPLLGNLTCWIDNSHCQVQIWTKYLLLKSLFCNRCANLIPDIEVMSYSWETCMTNFQVLFTGAKPVVFSAFPLKHECFILLYVPCLLWDQGYDREQHFFFIPRFTPAAHSPLPQIGRLQFQHYKFSVPGQQYSICTRL